MDFYNAKIELMKLADKLFVCTPKVITNDVDLEGKFDFIGADVHGAASFSPQESMEIENLNYQRDEQGRGYFSTFLTIVIQCGVYLGYVEKNKEIKDLKRQLADWKNICDMHNRESTRLNLNQMPKGNLEDEIVKLREENLNLKRSIQEQGIYERVIKTMVTSLNFDKKRV